MRDGLGTLLVYPALLLANVNERYHCSKTYPTTESKEHSHCIQLELLPAY
jgi:hypothetical protein